MNRKECEKALEQMEEAYYNSDNCFSALKEFSRNVELFYRLIHEHFDNTPLKFEELEETETYYHIYYGWISIRSISDCECILINTLNSDGYKQIEFEEDCFYRKQVE